MAITTPNLSLTLPAHGDLFWDATLVNAFVAIDTAWGILTLPWSSITGLPTTFPSDWNTLVNKPTIPTPVSLKVNGTATTSQSTLNLKAGANVTLADDGAGGVTITSAASGGSVVWGAITGTLSTQADLQTTLNAKEVSANKGVANGYAPLDASAKVPTTNLPSVNIVTKTASYTVAATDDIIIVNSQAATTVTLTTTGITSGKIFRVKNRNTGTVTVSPGISGNIDLTNGITLSLNESIDLAFDGLNFWIL